MIEDKNINNQIDSYKPQLAVNIVEGVVKNLPEIVSAIRDIFISRDRERMSNNQVKERLAKLKVQKDNFIALVNNLTILAKDKDSNEEVRKLYMNMIKELFQIFKDEMKSSSSFSDFLSK